MSRPATTTPVWALAAGVVLVLVTLAATVYGVVAWDDYRTADTAEQRRDEVAEVASQFVRDSNTYSYTDMEDLRARIEAQTTGDAKEQFVAQFEDTAKLAVAGKLESTANVLRAGVAVADSDSARVLVVADATATSVLQTRERHFRYEVSLVREDGEWLVDTFVPVVE